MLNFYFTRHRRSLLLAGLLAFGGLLTARAQTLPAATPPRRLTVQVHYGAAGNFFASSRRDSPSELQHVRFLGTAGGGEAAYRVGRAGAVALGYTRSVNMEQKHLPYVTSWGGSSTLDFRLRYVNNAFQAIYERALTADFRVHAGLLYMTTASQSVGIGYYATPNNVPLVSLQESNMTNNNPEEGGFVAGFEYSRPIDTRLRLGLKARGYYLASVSTFEMLTLTPTLTYRL